MFPTLWLRGHRFGRRHCVLVNSRFTTRARDCDDQRMPKANNPRLLPPQRSRGRARPDRSGPPGRRRGRPPGRGRGLSPHRSGRAQLSRAHRAQCGHVRPARLFLRLSLLRHSLVPEFRLRAEGLGQRRAHPRARADRRPCGMRRRRGTADERLLCSGPGRVVRGAGRHRRAQRPCARRAAVRDFCAQRTRWRSSPDRASASPRRPRSPGATGSRARAFSASRLRRHLARRA